jgi:hypothetical protein
MLAKGDGSIINISTLDARFFGWLGDMCLHLMCDGLTPLDVHHTLGSSRT